VGFFFEIKKQKTIKRAYSNRIKQKHISFFTYLVTVFVSKKFFFLTKIRCFLGLMNSI
jgi:hypothetical protein